MEATELQVLLKSSGRSQEWLATKLGVHVNSVWKWAHDRAAIPGARDARIRELLAPEPTVVLSRDELAELRDGGCVVRDGVTILHD